MKQPPLSMSSADPFHELNKRAQAPGDRVLSALRAEVQGELERDRAGSSPRKRRVSSRAERAWWSVLALTCGLLLTSISSFRLHQNTLLLAAGAYSLAVGAVLFAGIVPGNMSVWTRGPRRVLLGVLSLGLFVGLAIQAQSFEPLAHFLHQEGLRHTMPCFNHALVSGAIGATLLLSLWRRSDPFSPGLTGALLGLFGGALGTISVEISCASAEGLHLTLGHGLAPVIFAGFGFVVGRKWLTP